MRNCWKIPGFLALVVAGAAAVPSPAASPVDESRLDAWLTNPQAVVPGAIMPYRQANAETRAVIISYLKGLN